MKNLIETLYESLGRVKTTEISGTKFVKCSSKELNVDVDVKSGKWNKTELGKNKVVAYWSKDSEWIFYHPVDKPTEWAAFAPSDVKPEDFDENLFKANDFDDMLRDGATIPEFDSFDTDLK